MDQIKDAFSKVKEDFLEINNEIKDMKKELGEIQLSILELIKLNREKNLTTHPSTHELNNQTGNFNISTDSPITTHPSTHKHTFKSLKEVNIDYSTGNEGVSTDRQTDTSTDRQTHNILKKPLIKIPDPSIVLSQLDSLKKDIRLKIKRLTTQEMLVFSSIYQFEEQGEVVDYSLLSNNLKLSESSIRDYIQRIILKGVPIIKEKINNKKIILTISGDFKKLASLNTLLQLRDL